MEGNALFQMRLFEVFNDLCGGELILVHKVAEAWMERAVEAFKYASIYCIWYKAIFFEDHEGSILFEGGSYLTVLH